MSWIKKILPNPFEQSIKKLKKQNRQRVLIAWNRGLGDIPLGLYAMVHRLREKVPSAEINFFTRSDLSEGFSLLKDVSVFECPQWKRGTAFDLDQSLKDHDLKRSDFDLIIEKADPTLWVRWQLGVLTPQLYWKEDWDHLHEKFNLPPSCIGVHVQTETVYGYEKNWPVEKWKMLFQKIVEEEKKTIVLFGFKKTPFFEQHGVIDLRGETNLYELLSIIKNRCSALVVPDSGVLSLIYYLATPFPLHIVSLWSDPRQGVLKQNVASPNPYLTHRPLIGKDEDISTVSIEQVMRNLKSEAKK